MGVKESFDLKKKHRNPKKFEEKNQNGISYPEVFETNTEWVIYG